jgi:hypothetical protein
MAVAEIHDGRERTHSQDERGACVPLSGREKAPLFPRDAPSLPLAEPPRWGGSLPSQIDVITLAAGWRTALKARLTKGCARPLVYFLPCIVNGRPGRRSELRQRNSPATSDGVVASRVKRPACYVERRSRAPRWVLARCGGRGHLSSRQLVCWASHNARPLCLQAVTGGRPLRPPRLLQGARTAVPHRALREPRSGSVGLR